MNILRCCFYLTVFAAATGAVWAQPSVVGSASALKKLSLEELLSLQVTAVSRRAEPASRAATAVEVITAEQIVRTGATSVQDTLRFAAGVQVSGFGAHSFAISSRGLTRQAANKLQVMQGGRSPYSPLFRTRLLKVSEVQ